MNAGPETRQVRQDVDTSAYRVVGRDVDAHHDFVDKVVGTIKYASDWSLPGMVYAKLVRSPVPSATIQSVVTADALSMPGVIGVFTAKDVPNNGIVNIASGIHGEVPVSQPVLASERVRYTGEPVALVVATDERTAAAAAEMVDLVLEDEPGVFDAEEALEAESPRVHPEGPVLVQWNLIDGDVEAGMAEADVVVESEYRTQHVDHLYLETEGGTSWIDDGVVTIRASTQVVEHATTIARILDLPENKVRVIASFMGGGFGGKEDMTVEPYLALATWLTKRPVRMIWDRQESLVAGTKRHPFVMKYRTGVRSDGTIVAQEVDIIGDAGAYPLLSGRVLMAGATLALGPYRTGHTRVRSRAVFTNNVPTSAFRGFGAMQVVFGYESQLAKVATTLGMPPADVRSKNFLKKGDLLATGETVETAVWVDKAQAAVLERLHNAPKRQHGTGRRVGRGFACNMQPYGRVVWLRDHASAWLSLERDGSLVIRTGITDLGAGQVASCCELASEVLGIPLSEISIYIGDSALNPRAGGTFASRQLYMSGNAILGAARLLRERLSAVAATQLRTSESELVWEDGLVRARHRADESSRGLSMAELVALADLENVPTSYLYKWRAPVGEFDNSTGKGSTHPDYTYGCHGVEVEVDIETGVVRLLRYIACHDVGRQISPLRVKGQIQGGVAQGVGGALLEKSSITEGYPESSLFADYLAPTAIDLPDIEVIVLESGEGIGPLGARGIGEPPIGPSAAAIADAVFDAVGVRPTQLPMSPEYILQLLDEQAEEDLK